MSAPARRRWQPLGWLGASVLLHGASLAALVLVSARPAPQSAGEGGVSLIWEAQPETRGDGDGGDVSAVDATPPSPPPSLPAPPPVAAVPPLPSPPSPPALLPHPAVPTEEAMASILAPPAGPPPPPAWRPAEPAMAEALPTPPPSAPPLPRAAQSAPRPRAPQPAPSPAQTAATASGPGQQAAIGDGTERMTSPACPPAGVVNPSPVYPDRSRRRGDEGRVGMVARINPEGRVVHVEVVLSSGFPELDEAAERAVRRWRCEPATRGGRPVFSSVSLGINFRIEEGRRW